MVEIENDEIRDRLILDILKYNFEPEDSLEHGFEIIQQVWYEFYINNVNIVSVNSNIQ